MMDFQFVRRPFSAVVVVLAAIAFVVIPENAHAILAGRVSSLQGDVTVTRLGELNPRPVSRMMEIHVNDQITTGSDGRVRILFTDDSVVSLAENSKLRVSKQVYNPAARQRESVIDLFRGKVRSVVSRYLNTQINRFEVRTPNAVAGVRGSVQVTEYDPATNTTTMTMTSGTGYLQGHNGENFTIVDAGNQGTGGGQSGFQTSQLDQNQMNNLDSGFETEQGDDSAPPPTGDTTTTGSSDSGDQSSDSTGETQSGDSGGSAGTGGDASDSGDSGPKTAEVVSSDTDQQSQSGEQQPGSDSSSGGGQPVADNSTSDPGSSLSEGDLGGVTAPVVVPIPLEPPPAFSTVRAVITLPN